MGLRSQVLRNTLPVAQPSNADAPISAMIQASQALAWISFRCNSRLGSVVGSTN
jgi:hypothetical protein